MIDKLLNSKFIQKLKTIKHIEVIIVVLFILLLLIIYFVNFGEKKDDITGSSTISTSTQTTYSNSLFQANSDGLINITQNYKQTIENELTNLIYNSTRSNIAVNVILNGGEILYSLDSNEDASLSNDNISITVSGGAVIVNYEPEIDKVILSGAQNLSVQEKLTITDLTKSYLDISINKIFLY